MKIKFDQNGLILGVGDVSEAAEISSSDIPVDFMSTFSLGKYSIVNDLIVEDLNFVLPTPDMPV